MPSGIALADLNQDEAETLEKVAARAKGPTFRAPGARTGAQNVGNAFAQRPFDLTMLDLEERSVKKSGN